MLEFDPKATVVSSFSKYFCMPGWRLGWLLASPDLVERTRAYIGSMFLSAPAISQHVALAALELRLSFAASSERIEDALSRLEPWLASKAQADTPDNCPGASP
jgi:histidinol-phosphate/aromatic aminotransferase/cobyric acid decarboxylase-like protein